jgi:hypothetical protein
MILLINYILLNFISIQSLLNLIGNNLNLSNII